MRYKGRHEELIN